MKSSLLIFTLCASIGAGIFIVQDAQSENEESPRLRFAEERIMDRLNAIEKQLVDMERAFYKDSKGFEETSPEKDNSQIVIRMEQIDSQLKQLTGKLENIEHRLATSTAQATNPATVSNAKDDAPASMSSNHKKIFKKVEPTETEISTAKKDTSKKPVEKKVITAREEYDAAFELLKSEKYDEAAKAFLVFIESHPNEHLTENAHYWLAESYFAKNDFEQAAVEFLRGYQSHPLGSKAPDNLLKLAISLGEIDKVTEACGSLDKLHGEFPNASLAIKQRSNKEYSKLDCS